jgi:hypothetical protein
MTTPSVPQAVQSCHELLLWLIPQLDKFPRVPRLSGTGDSAKDLAVLPGNRFETLKGNRKGQYSIRINDQWRVCFQWPKGSPGPVHVEIVDYH